MAGNVAMMLGSFAFEAIGFGFEGIKRRTNTPWVDVPVAQTLNQQQWTGATSDELTISGVIFPLEFGGLSQLEGLRSEAFAGEPLVYVSGDMSEGSIHGTYTIQSIDEDGTYYDNRAQARKVKYSIKLKRYGDSDTPVGFTNLKLFG